MKKIIAITIAVILVVAVVLSVAELRASNKLLKKIQLLRPGIPLAAVSNQLGDKMYEIEDVDHMMHLGSVKDATFCRDKKLFWFYASTPPCRALEVYTDTSNVVVYVTWQGL